MLLPSYLKILALKKEQVAHKAGIAPATLSRLLRDRQEASPDTVARVEQAIVQLLAEGGGPVTASIRERHQDAEEELAAMTVEPVAGGRCG